MMAAFCTCCGAEITRKAEACIVCGTPLHGMMPANATLSTNNLTPVPPETSGKKSRGTPSTE